MLATLITLAAPDGGILDTISATGEQFGFNWGLFLSQIISFSIVALLLQMFAYKPIIAVLETRRRTIAEGLENAEKSKLALANAESQAHAVLLAANQEAKGIIDEARKSAAVIAEKRQQQAVSEAEQIIAKAHEATQIEREKVMAQLRSEIGRLVVSTTSKVTGKVLTPDDQRRLNEEAARQVAA